MRSSSEQFRGDGIDRLAGAPFNSARTGSFSSAEVELAARLEGATSAAASTTRLSSWIAATTGLAGASGAERSSGSSAIILGVLERI